MNIKDLRNALIGTFTLLQDGKVDFQTAKELNSTASKIMMSAKIEMDYNRNLSQDKTIDFLETDVEDTTVKKKAGRPKK